MKIDSFNIQLQSNHVKFEQATTSEQLEMWVGERGGGRPRNSADLPAQGSALLVNPIAQERVALSREGLAAQKGEAIDEAVDAAENDPRMKLLRTLIEFLTGERVKVLRMEDMGNGDAPSHTEEARSTPQRGDGRAGFGIDYSYSASRVEFEAVSFQAQGTVRTSDGMEVSFDLSLAMERSFAESIDVRFTAGNAGQLKDPLVLDFAGTGAALSNLRFSFDLDADGSLDEVPMLMGGSGFLAIDRNDNGRIDDGRELFGPTSGSGFAELAALDTDGNGWIDEADPAFTQLRLWQPDADGGGRLQTLAEAGVGALYLANVATPFDLRGSSNETLGLMRASNIYLRDNGSVGTVSQIDLSV